MWDLGFPRCHDARMSDAGPPAGRRVSLRQRLPRRSATGNTGGDRFADAVGELAVESGRLVVIRSDGSRAPVRPERVVAVREVPPAVRAVPATARGANPDSLARLAAAHWPATEEVGLGQWRLRAAGGFTRRANSTLAVGDPGTALPTALVEVADWYSRRSLPGLLNTADAELIAAANALGWRRVAGHEVLLARVADVMAGFPDGWDRATAETGRPPGATGTTVSLAAEPSQQWLADYRRADRHPNGPAVLRAPAGTTGLFATLRGGDGAADGRLVGGLVGRGRVVVSAGWAGLSCVAVAEPLRRHGLARLMVGWLLDAALDAGALRCYVQVEPDNIAALALYRSLGFRDSHAVSYLLAPDC